MAFSELLDPTNKRDQIQQQIDVRSKTKKIRTVDYVTTKPKSEIQRYKIKGSNVYKSGVVFCTDYFSSYFIMKNKLCKEIPDVKIFLIVKLHVKACQ